MTNIVARVEEWRPTVGYPKHDLRVAGMVINEFAEDILAILDAKPGRKR